MKGLQLNGTWTPREGYNPTPREIKDQRALCAKNIWYDPSLKVVELPDPEPKDNEVLMKVGACGICGSDMCFLNIDKEGYLDYVGHTKLPVVIGHEFAGEVVKVGKDVTRFKPGDLITGETMNWCGECDTCRTGMFNQCENLEEIGFSINGGMGQYLVIQEKFCLNINELLTRYKDKQLAMEVGATVEPTAVAYNGIFTRGGGFMPGSNVAVFGAGPIGLSAVQLVKAAGASKIFVFEFSKPRLELARKLGATHICDMGEYPKQGETVESIIMRETGGVGIHMAVECTAHCDKNLPELEKALAVGGKTVQIGHHPGTSNVYAQIYQKRAGGLYGSNGSSGHGIWENVIRLIASGVIDPSQIIADRFKLDDAIKGLETARSGIGGKYMITPNL